MSRKAAFVALISLAAAIPAFPGAFSAGAPARSGQEAEITQAKGQRPRPQPPGMRLRPGSERGNEPQEPVVLFHIGDKAYMESDFIDYLPVMLPAGRAEQIRRNPHLLVQARKAFADQMLLATLARKEGLDNTPEVKKKIDAQVTFILQQEALRLKGPNMDRDIPQPTDEQARAYYEQNVDTYKTAEKATARHILASVKADGGESGDADAKAKLEKARKALKGGKSWQEVAKEFSDDPGSRDKGGLMENFDPSGTVPEFAAAVRAQEIGALGPPVKTQFGYHMILVESRTPAQTQAFDDVKGRVRTQMLGKMRTDAWGAFLDSLRAELGFSEAKLQDGSLLPQVPQARSHVNLRQDRSKDKAEAKADGKADDKADGKADKADGKPKGGAKDKPRGGRADRGK